MSKLLVNNIKFTSEDFTFDFDFRDGTTVVLGYSGTGKSLFYERFSAKVYAEGLNNYKLLNYQTLSFVNTDDIYRGLSRDGQVYIIDNADMVLKGIPNLKNFLTRSSSQFIIFGRRTENYNITMYNCANVIETDRYFRLQYLFGN